MPLVLEEDKLRASLDRLADFVSEDEKLIVSLGEIDTICEVDIDAESETSRESDGRVLEKEVLSVWLVVDVPLANSESDLDQLRLDERDDVVLVDCDAR